MLPWWGQCSIVGQQVWRPRVLAGLLEELVPVAAKEILFPLGLLTNAEADMFLKGGDGQYHAV